MTAILTVRAMVAAVMAVVLSASLHASETFVAKSAIASESGGYPEYVELTEAEVAFLFMEADADVEPGYQEGASVETSVIAGAGQPFRVAVIDFSSAEGEAFTSCNITMSPMREAGSAFSEAIAERIGAWSDYEVVDRDEVVKAIEAHNFSRKGLQSIDSLQKLGQVLGVHLVLVGQTEGSTWSGKGHAGGSLYAALQMHSAVSSDVLWSLDGSVTDTRTSRHLIASLADDMTERLYAEIQAVESLQSMLAFRTVEN